MVRVLRLLRWVLFFEGWLLLAAPAAVDHWSGQIVRFLPNSAGANSDSFITFLAVASWAVGALCLATFWGMGAQKPWVRATGLAVSLINLLLFPPLGLTGLIAMRRFTRYNEPGDADQNALVEETYFVRIGRVAATTLMVIAGSRWISSFGEQLGLDGPGFNWFTVVSILASQLLVAMIHEVSHTLAARAFGFRFSSYRLGPITWMGGSTTINFGRLFAHDSYLASVPANPLSVRWDLIAAAAAGPIVSLVIGLALFLGMLRAPGTAAAGEGQFLGILALLFALDFSMQILPFGFSDGRVLVDLLSYNRRGRNMVLQMTAASGSPQTDSLARFAFADYGLYADPTHLLRENLNQLLRRGVVGGNELANAYQMLGVAEVLTGRWGSAKDHLERSVELLNVGQQANRLGATWMWAEKLYRLQQRGVESHYAYGRAVKYWEAAKEKAPRMNDVFEACTALAALHLGQGELGSCMEEIDEAEPIVPRDPALLLLTGQYHQAAAACGFRMRWTERGRTHALAAARAYTDTKLKPEIRGLGLLHLGDLAYDCWIAGQSQLAAELLAQAIGGFAPSDASCWLRLLRAEILAKTGHRAEAGAELDQIQEPDSEQEMRIASILGWSALTGGRYLDSAEFFETASITLDEREKARQRVAQARALTHASKFPNARALAKAACDALMREEHGEAGMALLLLAADEYRNDPLLDGHPYFEEGCRIVGAARFFPLPDKLLGLRDVLSHYEALNRELEISEIREEIRKIEAQMSWDQESMSLAKPAA